IHGDASFAAQGVVAETFNLARLRGYTTGGTIHLIANNQLGFTTDPKEARSTDYASDLAKGFDAPIIHVNADDPEACLAAVRVAMMYRDQFHGDVVIDVVGYRRHGHNEGDEPAYTHPLMYERIRQTPPVRQRYADQLAREGVLERAQADAEAERFSQRLYETQQSMKAHLAEAGQGEEPQRISGAQPPEPDTAVATQVLTGLNAQLLTVPEGFTVNPKLKKQLERRRGALTDGGIDWAHAEALVLWEAQYGDFTNGAEVIIDQFLIAGLAKWRQTSRLTLLLPHGYEGQGPEHSSARIERFLALGAEGNLRIANCTTPAQYFHLLRRQGRHAELRPLVLFTPKSLLRLPQAASRLEELTTGRFRPVLDDP